MKNNEVPKIGLGYDVHAFCDGRKLVLGGVEVPYARGLDGHSDADVILHAVCDALLGALGEGDIGDHFPNTDSRFKNISSLILLENVFSIVQRRGYCVGNVDVTVLAEEPNLKKFKLQMKENISKILKIEVSSVNVKATTQEKLGSIGRKEGIAAFATTIIYREDRE